MPFTLSFTAESVEQLAKELTEVASRFGAYGVQVTTVGSPVDLEKMLEKSKPGDGPTPLASSPEPAQFPAEDNDDAAEDIGEETDEVDEEETEEKSVISMSELRKKAEGRTVEMPAPKKRGRKPGTKNKPKEVAVEAKAPEPELSKADVVETPAPIKASFEPVTNAPTPPPKVESPLVPEVLPPAEPSKKVTQQDVFAVMQEVRKVFGAQDPNAGINKVLEILEPFHVQRIAELSDNKLGPCFEAARRVLANGGGVGAH